MRKIYLTAIILILFHPVDLDAKQYKDQIKYLSPVPGSNYNSTETNIIIKFTDEILQEELNSIIISVIGNKSGIHQGRTILKNNNKTLLFYPTKSFDIDEIVIVRLINIKQKNSGKDALNFKYSFRTSKIKLNSQNYVKNELIKNLIPAFKANQYTTFNAEGKNTPVTELSLPSDFPDMKFEQNTPAPGVISFAPFSVVDGVFLPNYMIILDNSGQPVFYRKTTNAILDFKKQDNGLLSYFDIGAGKYYLMDTQMKVVDSAAMKNDYPTDLHEFVITDNNHYLLMSYDIQKIAMDTVVEGGNPEASVVGLIIQEQDENRDVVFQWRSWDYFKITDATYDIDLNGEYIDYSHGNAIELDTDGNILISSRHMDEITKINRETGEIMWRWGGKYCKNNQFSFVNDSTGFSHQHDIRRLSNGNLMLFDNGNLHNPPFSRAAEFYVDEELKIASLVWEYRSDPAGYSIAMGSARRLSNDNTIIGWGLNTVPPSISEVTMDGRTTMNISLPGNLINYRAFKFTWRTSVFTSDVDSVRFGTIKPGSSAEGFINLTNNDTEPIDINEYYLRSQVFTLEEKLPLRLLPGQTKKLSLKFKPIQQGQFTDILYLRWRDSTQMIAQTIALSGYADTLTTSVTNSKVTQYSLSQNYPNPFNPVTVINYSIPEEAFVKIKIYNTLGCEIAVLKNEFQKSGSYTINFNGEEFPSGIYYYTIDTGKFFSTKKMMLLK